MKRAGIPIITVTLARTAYPTMPDNVVKMYRLM